MNAIIGDSIVSCYVDVAALLVMILLLVQSKDLRRRKNDSLRYYFLLAYTVTFTCAVCFVFNAMYGQTAPWCHTAALVSRTLWECCVLVTVTLWLAFVDSKLYGKRTKWTAVRVIRVLPLFVFPALLAVNLFTGIVFTISDSNSLQPRPLFYAIMATNFILFISSAAEAWLYDRQSAKIRFIRVYPMILSVFVMVLPQFISRYNTGIMGYAIGMTLLFLSMISENRFVDDESGLYNNGYLAYLFDLAVAGKSDAQSAMILEADGSLTAGFEILRSVLHRTGDVIRTEENKFLMFSRADSRSTLQYLISLADEAAEKHNREHPGDKVSFTARCRMKELGEDDFTFLRTVMDDRDTGDEMKGIVSMISELDRLDKELKLAADIQISMLPTNFPAFPDRTEFDLYASMKPAREVGGDFYDFFLIDGDRLAVVIADVSGKGIPAALFMMMSKTLIRNQLMSGCDPASALERVNLQLYERNTSMMFVTVWAAVLELSTGRGLACNAGHENPVIRRGDGTFETLKYRHDIIVGVNRKAKYTNREFEMGPGDCVMVYTDGVTEACDVNGALFGEKRIDDALNEDPGAGPEELIRRLGDAVGRFAEGAPQADDITMLCLKYHGAQSAGKAEK